MYNGLELFFKSIFVLQSLQQLNLNACQKITDSGVIFVASANSNLKSFSIYWSLKYVPQQGLMWKSVLE